MMTIRHPLSFHGVRRVEFESPIWHPAKEGDKSFYLVEIRLYSPDGEMVKLEIYSERGEQEFDIVPASYGAK